jgi:pyruvate dehydrogenase E2 component (dihydrolipoamide acetyltransferase)/2-oxoglutarate dehydrogenase E2 component (dihydrolipoamide succinyltransferase)
MIVQVVIPRVGVNVTEFRLVEWKAKEGDRVEKGSTVLQIETEKTQWEVEAEITGFLHILVEAGTKAAVDEAVGAIAETREELQKLQADSGTVLGTVEAAEGEASPRESVETAGEGRIHRGKRGVLITPVARKMAEEHMLDVTQIKGTGPGGRIGRKDVEAAIQAQAGKRKEAPPIAYHGRRIRSVEPLRGIRQAIAERMYRSLSTSAQMTVLGEWDMSRIVLWREDLFKEEGVSGVRISYVDIMVFILARALRKHPAMNCSFLENEIKFWEDINVGVAFALGEEGLIVPVVKGADKKSLSEISQEIRKLGEKARERKLLPDEVTGGTFTLSTVGKQSESRFQTPILNEPEAAILAVGAVEDRPVVREGQIVIRPIMPYSMTFDHRVINGFAGEQFLRTIRGFLESPLLLLL